MNDVNPRLTHRQRQALETQRIIVDAARDLFLQRGYGATTIEAISQQAGVAVSTVYAIYKNKRGILRAIREAWHQQSTQRDLYAQAVSEPDPRRKLHLAAHATRRQWETSAAMMSIYRAAASVDAEAADELSSALAGRRAGIGQFVQAIHECLNPALSMEQATAITLALTRAEVYQELVEVGGWSAEDYERWLADVLAQQLLPIATDSQG